MQPHEHTGGGRGATAYNDLRGRLRAKESCVCVSGERGLPSVLQKRLPRRAPVHPRKQSLVNVRKPLSQEKACDTLCFCVYLLSFFSTSPPAAFKAFCQKKEKKKLWVALSRSCHTSAHKWGMWRLGGWEGSWFWHGTRRHASEMQEVCWAVVLSSRFIAVWQVERGLFAVQTCKLGGPHFRSCKSGLGLLVMPCFRHSPLVGKPSIGRSVSGGGCPVALSICK